MRELLGKHLKKEEERLENIVRESSDATEEEVKATIAKFLSDKYKEFIKKKKKKVVSDDETTFIKQIEKALEEQKLQSKYFSGNLERILDLHAADYTI